MDLGSLPSGLGGRLGEGRDVELQPLSGPVFSVARAQLMVADGMRR